MDNLVFNICERSEKGSKVRKNGEIKGLRPDGKVQVTVEYNEDEIKKDDWRKTKKLTIK